jgi:hypothetical protein
VLLSDDEVSEVDELVDIIDDELTDDEVSEVDALVDIDELVVDELTL